MADIAPFLHHYDSNFAQDTKRFFNPNSKAAAQVRTLFDGSAVRRFHTMCTVTENTVGQHSHGVAMFCMLLEDGNPSAALLMKALTHDLAEQYTGDVPSPAKRALGIRKEFGEVEEQLLATVEFSIEITEREEKVLKLADCADGMLFCARERTLGNKSKMIKAAYKFYNSAVITILDEMEKSPFTARAYRVFDGVHAIWKESKQ